MNIRFVRRFCLKTRELMNANGSCADIKNGQFAVNAV